MKTSFWAAAKPPGAAAGPNPRRNYRTAWRLQTVARRRRRDRCHHQWQRDSPTPLPRFSLVLRHRRYSLTDPDVTRDNPGSPPVDRPTRDVTDSDWLAPLNHSPTRHPVGANAPAVVTAIWFRAPRPSVTSRGWPMLRREAERRFAADEPPAQVISELRQTYRDGPAMVPSLRTMRRWFTQARRLARPSTDRRAQSRPPAPAARANPYRRPLVDLLITGVAYPSTTYPRHATRRGP